MNFSDIFHFSDISHFDKTTDFLPIFLAVLVTDMLFLSMMIAGVFYSSKLAKWYHLFGIGAVMADIFILFIGILIARMLYPYFFSKFNLFYFLGVALLVQIIHDTLFGLAMMSIPLNQNQVVDVFKEYIQEVNSGAIVADSFMMTSSVILSSLFASWKSNYLLSFLIVILYIVPFLLYQKRYGNKTFSL